MTKPTLAPCPQCGTQTVLSIENPFMPFCSRRCKDADFLHWANDEHRIPEVAVSWDAANDNESS